MPHDSEPELLQGAFLPDPEEGVLRFYNPEARTFATLSAERCNVLLGEVGMGKSRSLAGEHELLSPAWEKNQELAALVDLGDVGSRTDLHLKIAENEVVQQWRGSGRILHLSLDSLDEALANLSGLQKGLIEEINAILEEGLRLTVACRAGEWPQFLQTALKDIFGEGEASVWHLTPLRQKDVKAAAAQWGIDGDKFLAAISEKDLEPLAARPLTLELLLRAGTSLPQSVGTLYYSGCNALISEDPSSSRAGRSFRLSIDQRIAIAGRIACLTLFSGRPVVTLLSDMEASTAVGCDALIGNVEGAPEASFTIGRVDILEVLHTSLFDGSGQRFRWSHKSFAEYLAARHLQNDGVSLRQIMSLLGIAGQVAPQLAGIAAWLASMRNDVRSEILRVDPEILLNADLSTTDTSVRAGLIRWLVDQAEIKSPFLYQWDLFWKYRKLNHSGLQDQLMRLLDPLRAPKVRSLAIEIANACGGAGITPLLADLALRESEPVLLRIDAAACVTKHGSDAEKSLLAPLALRKGSTSDQELLQVQALSAAWPKHLSWEQLRDVYGEADYSPTTSLGRFIAYDMPEHFPPGELAGALAWLAEKYSAPYALSAWSCAADRLIHHATSYSDKPDVRHSITELLLIRVKTHHRLYDARGSRDHGLFPHEPAEHRQAIAAELIPRITSEPYAVAEALKGQDALLLRSDINFVVQEWRRSPSDLRRPWELLIGWLTDWDNAENRKVVFRLAGDDRELRNALCKWWQERREVLQRDAALRASNEASRTRERFERIDGIRSLLRQCEEDVLRIPGLLMEMSFRFDGNGSGSLSAPDLRELPVWPILTDEERSRLVDVGKTFLVEASCFTVMGLRKGLPTHNSLTAYKILRFLLVSDRAYIAVLPSAIWQKWASAIVLFQASADAGQLNEVDAQLFQRALSHAHQQAAFTASALLRTGRIRNPERILRWLTETLRSEAFEQTMFDITQSQQASEAVSSACATVLFARGHSEIRRYVEAEIQRISELETPVLQRIASSAAVWLENDVSAWQTIWPNMKKSPTFAELVFDVAGNGRMRAAVIGERLSVAELAELFMWLRGEFGYTFEVDAYRQRPGYHVQGSILHWLKERRSHTAVGALHQLEEKWPDDWWVRQASWEATRLLLEHSWEPIEPAIVRQSIEDPRRRWIRDESELLEVVVEALHDYQALVRGEGDRGRRLWNEYHVGHTLRCKPKPEEPLSREIALEIGDLLRGRGVSAKLEPKIREGQFIDIYVSATTAGRRHRVVSLIIEVKACWNPELKTSLETQLAERYLKGLTPPIGIYLVVAFDGSQWDEEDSRRDRCLKESPHTMTSFFEEQAKHVNSRHGTMIRAFVLDAALP